MKKRKEKRKISVLAIGYCAAILSAGVLTACSGARKDTSYREDNSIKSGAYGEAEAERSDEAAFAGAQVAKSNAVKDSVVTKENEVPGASQGEAAEETVPEVSNPDSNTPDSNTPDSNTPDSNTPDAAEDSNVQISEKKIRTVNMEIDTKDIPEKAKALREKVKAMSGYVESEDFQDNDSYSDFRRMYFTIRIPKDKMDEFLSFVEGEGQIKSRSENLEDVRLQYHDAQAHKNSLEKEQERVLALMDKAENLDQLLILENRLTEIRYQLENYGSQILEYDNRINFATLNLTLTEKSKPEAREQKEEGFKDRLKTGFKENLYGIKWFFEALLFLILVYSPQIIGIAAIVLLLIFLHKREQKTRAKRAKAMEQESLKE